MAVGRVTKERTPHATALHAPLRHEHEDALLPEQDLPQERRDGDPDDGADVDAERRRHDVPRNFEQASVGAQTSTHGISFTSVSGNQLMMTRSSMMYWMMKKHGSSTFDTGSTQAGAAA